MKLGEKEIKILVNSHQEHRPNNIKINGEHLSEINIFKYLESIICNVRSSRKEIKTRHEIAISAMTRMNLTRNSNMFTRQNKTIQATCDIHSFMWVR